MSQAIHIRPLDSVEDLGRVEAFYNEAPEYWLLADRVAPDVTKAVAFFTDGPPNCDSEKSHRMGLFLGQRLSGVAELSFGFPEPKDAYLGLMMLGQWAQGRGICRAFLSHLEALARSSDASDLYLAVLNENPRDRSFWEREGFTDTRLSGTNDVAGQPQTLHQLHKAL